MVALIRATSISDSAPETGMRRTCILNGNFSNNRVRKYEITHSGVGE